MKEKQEIWKSIPDYENYEVSSLGKVRSLNYHGWGKIQELKLLLSKNGYYRVFLYKDGKAKPFCVHQLIAIVFLEHVINGHKLVIDHINEIKTDNRLENLQIITNRKNKTKSIERNLPTGVCFLKGKYTSRIRIVGKQRYLGTFSTPEEASQAYQNALKI
jgi:hypothetical protein